MRTAVVPSQATDVLCLPCPGRKRGLEGDHLARELLSHRHDLADVKKSYASTLACECRGTDHTFLVLQMAFQPKWCKWRTSVSVLLHASIEAEERGMLARHNKWIYARRKQCFGIKLRGAIKRWETGDTHSRDTHLLLFNHSRVQQESLWPSAWLSTSIFKRQEEPCESGADSDCSLTVGASICSWRLGAL